MSNIAMIGLMGIVYASDFEINYIANAVFMADTQFIVGTDYIKNQIFS